MYLATSLVALFLLLIPNVALANHGHLVGQWQHGLGDGTDNDFFVYPNIRNTSGRGSFMAADLMHYPGVLGGTCNSSSCSKVDFYLDCTNCTKLTRNRDTNPGSECRYYTYVYGFDSTVNDLPAHLHYHDRKCWKGTGN